MCRESLPEEELDQQMAEELVRAPIPEIYLDAQGRICGAGFFIPADLPPGADYVVKMRLQAEEAQHG